MHTAQYLMAFLQTSDTGTILPKKQEWTYVSLQTVNTSYVNKWNVSFPRNTSPFLNENFNAQGWTRIEFRL